MAIPLQHRRGTEAQNDAFIGLIGEVTVDTENNNLRLHDGVTAGGKVFYNASNVLSGFKNGIINPSFAVNQYADIDTAPVAMVASTYQIDRFWSYVTGVTATIQRMPKSLLNGKYVHSVKCVATSTNSSAGMYLRQKIEIFYNGESKTFGAWVKSNNTNARIILTDGVVTTTDAHSGSGLWEFLSFPKIIDINANNLTAYVGIQRSDTTPNIAISSGDYIESTMWQLEDGSVPTKFEQRPVGLELSLCQRYYETTADNSPPMSFGTASTTTVSSMNATFKVKKRVTPTIVIYSYLNTAGKVSQFNGTVDAGTSVTASQKSEYGFSSVQDSGAGFTIGTQYWCKYTASAEL